MPKRGKKKSKVKYENKKRIIRPNNKMAVENNIDTENERIMLMRVGVACFMVIFFVAWIINLRYQFKISSDNSNKNSFNWEQTKADLDKSLEQLKSGIAEIKQTQTATQNTLPNESELTSEQISLLKVKLMGEVASSTIATSTTAISTTTKIKK